MVARVNCQLIVSVYGLSRVKRSEISRRIGEFKVSPRRCQVLLYVCQGNENSSRLSPLFEIWLKKKKKKAKRDAFQFKNSHNSLPRRLELLTS